MSAVLENALAIPEDQQSAALILRLGVLEPGDVAAAIRHAEANGRSLEEHLAQTGQLSRADMIQMRNAQGHHTIASRMSDLPEWDVILNEPGQGGVLGAQRDNKVAVLASTKDRLKRCFMVIADGVARDHAQKTIAKIAHTGHRLAGSIQASDELLQLIYGQLDSHGEQRSKDTEDMSDLQKEFDALGYAAFKMGASDIHISASRGRGAIHMRVHGDLEHYKDITEDHARSLCSAIYNTLAEEGSTKESFNPDKVQDAVVERVYAEGMIRFRYSGLNIAPSGFDVTLRVIPIGVTTRRKTLEQLGYSVDQCQAMERMFSYSSGLILFAGTTGSGKSTTMANQLSWVAEQRPGKKIRTVEEPVEYKIEGAYQTPVKRINGDKSDFLIVLRQILRSDPDILGVGEIRDLDTAELAISGVRSGHMLVSTIHADGAPIIYDRLAGMGVNRYDLASVGLVRGLIYQKLVQLLCPECKVPATDVRAMGMHREVLARVESVCKSLDGVYFRNESGTCHHCKGKGIIGRTVCAEILRPTPRMLKPIADANSTGLWKLWRETIARANDDDMTGRTSFEHALWKIKQGVVCPISVEKEFHFLDEAEFDMEMVG